MTRFWELPDEETTTVARVVLTSRQFLTWGLYHEIRKRGAPHTEALKRTAMLRKVSVRAVRDALAESETKIDRRLADAEDQDPRRQSTGAA